MRRKPLTSNRNRLLHLRGKMGSQRFHHRRLQLAVTIKRRLNFRMRGLGGLLMMQLRLHRILQEGQSSLRTLLLRQLRPHLRLHLRLL